MPGAADPRAAGEGRGGGSDPEVNVYTRDAAHMEQCHVYIEVNVYTRDAAHTEICILQIPSYFRARLIQTGPKLTWNLKKDLREHPWRPRSVSVAGGGANRGLQCYLRSPRGPRAAQWRVVEKIADYNAVHVMAPRIHSPRLGSRLGRVA